MISYENTIGIIACSKGKSATPRRAELFYNSPLFTKQAQLMRISFRYWFILSAKYGLTRPTDILSPYDLTLRRMSKDQLEQWNKNVKDQLTSTMQSHPDVQNIFTLANPLYRAPLEALPWKVECPVTGVPLGYQLQWLNSILNKGT